jgi:hypothetical protein
MNMNALFIYLWIVFSSCEMRIVPQWSCSKQSSTAAASSQVVQCMLLHPSCGS